MRLRTWWLYARKYGPRLAGAAVIFGVTLATLLYAESLSTDHLEQQYMELQTERSRLARAVSSLPPPSEANIEDSQPQLNYVIDTTRNTYDDIKYTTNRLENGMAYPWLAVASTEYETGETWHTHRSLQSKARSIRQITGPYASTVIALEDFLSYEPTVDMANFSPGSADTQKRMERLREGLEQTRTDVSQADADGMAEDILALLKAAENARQTLKTEEDVEEFASTINELQVRAVSVLDTHYQELTSQTEARLLEISHVL